MVLAALAGGPEARDARAQIQPMDQAELLELLERAIDARAPDSGPALAELVLDPLGGDRAGLSPEALDDRSTGGAALVAGGGEPLERVLDPFGAVSAGAAHARNLGARTVQSVASRNTSTATPMIAVLGGSESTP